MLTVENHLPVPKNNYPFFILWNLYHILNNSTNLHGKYTSSSFVITSSLSVYNKVFFLNQHQHHCEHLQGRWPSAAALSRGRLSRITAGEKCQAAPTDHVLASKLPQTENHSVRESPEKKFQSCLQQDTTVTNPLALRDLL